MPDMTTRSERRRLCVGMATFDDLDGVWFTIQAIRLFHSEVADKLEFLIVDNHPEGAAAASLKALEDWIPIPEVRALPRLSRHQRAGSHLPGGERGHRVLRRQSCAPPARRPGRIGALVRRSP